MNSLFDIFDRDKIISNTHLCCVLSRRFYSRHRDAMQEFFFSQRTIRICTGDDGQSSIIIRRLPRGDV